MRLHRQGWRALGLAGGAGVAVLIGAAARADPAPAAMNAPATTNAPAAAPSGPSLWFPVGEELYYRVRWGIFPVGKCRVASAWVDHAGRRCIAIRYRVLTNALFSRIYPMDDYAESVVDPETFLPLRFEFIKARHSELAHDVVTFDHARHVARLDSRWPRASRDVPIAGDTRDIVSFMYWMRRADLPCGTDATYSVMINDGLVDLRVTTAGATNLLHHPVFGNVPCLQIQPEADLRGLLVEKGHVTLWETRDARRLAPFLTARGPLANVRVTLCHVAGPGTDAWTDLAKNRQGEAQCAVSPDVEAQLLRLPKLPPDEPEK